MLLFFKVGQYSEMLKTCDSQGWIQALEQSPPPLALCLPPPAPLQDPGQEYHYVSNLSKNIIKIHL